MKIIRLKLNKTKPAAPKRWIATAVREAGSPENTFFNRRTERPRLARLRTTSTRIRYARSA